ncbi:MAG: hypothetical protein Q8934_12020 [Bacillota bacterium]|nr:hypothetical protein [Bacillota bacterium]
MVKNSFSQKQIALPMIENFPNVPKECPPNWFNMANKVNEFIMDSKNGVLQTDENGYKYFTAFLEGKSKELITFGCVTLGKILWGDDVKSLLPTLSDFYSELFGLFLNSPKENRIEYWYLMDVNALTNAIIKLKLSDDSLLSEKLRNSTNKLIELAHTINYDFNNQGYHFDQNNPFTVRDEFRQPDAIAGYAYLMAFAYEFFKEESYLEEAKKAIEIYQSFDVNPWYEIPSGAMACLAAAHLNSKGFNFDLFKILNFVFDSELGSMLAGKWGESEINGIMIGWRGFTREEATSSAYSMETMIVLPYVLPVVRYAPEYARTIGKYALHVASNARLFFSEFLPADFQSRPDLRPEIPYEKLCKEYKGYSPFGTGDCEGHKSVYGGGFTLWWGSIINTTNEEYIPCFNVTKTDFLERDAYPTFLYYNPFDDERSVKLDVGNEVFDVYELTSHQLLYSQVSGTVDIVLPEDTAKVVAVVPSSGNKSIIDGKLTINGIVVDYHFNQKEE